MTELKYPYVECDEHPGEREPGYLVCPHVSPQDCDAHIELATKQKLGVISCSACHAHGDQLSVLMEYSLSCASCVRGFGFNTVTQ